MTEYTPTTGEVRSLYKSGAWLMPDRAPRKFDPGEYEGVVFGEFDRWLNEIRAEAWDEGWERSIDFERSWRFAVKNGETVPQRPRNPYRPTEK